MSLVGSVSCVGYIWFFLGNPFFSRRCRNGEERIVWVFRKMLIFFIKKKLFFCLLAFFFFLYFTYYISGRLYVVCARLFSVRGEGRGMEGRER